jgi:cytochrome P450
MGTSTDAGVLDLEALGEDFVRDPYPLYARLRAQGPVHRVRTPQGVLAWLVVGYEAARAALGDPRLSKDWSKLPDGQSAGMVDPGRHMLISDPPDHTRLRRLVSREFTPRRIAALEPRIQQLTDELLDAMLAQPGGRADLVDAFAFPLPMGVICELLGVPFMEREAFRAWSNTLVSPAPADVAAEAMARMAEYLGALVEHKRARPGDDLLSGLVRTTDEDGDRLSADELRGMAWLLLIAGHETTVNLIANGVLALLTHPDQLAALRADPALTADAVEEMLRYDGPVESSTYRFTLEPVDLAGVRVPAGEVVLPVIADADRDAAHFPEPDGFDIRRGGGRAHLAFGHGMHYCLGAPLARLEARVAVRTLLERAPDLALDADHGTLRWRPGLLIRGPQRLPVRF